MSSLVFLSRDILEYEKLKSAFNPSVVSIEYSQYDTLEQIQIKIDELTNTSFLNLCFIFSDDHSGNSKFAGENLFISENLQSNLVYNLISGLKSRFGFSYIDFLACNLLRYPSWFNYFQNLGENFNITVRASDDATGNLKNGADWVLETTGENIKSIYFNETIEQWEGVLDHSTTTNGILVRNNTTNELDYYAFGINSIYGELGTPLWSSSVRESQYYTASGVTIKTSGDWRDHKVSFGWRFGAFITTDEKIYSFGYNENNQLGTGDLLSSSKPRLILDGTVIGKTFKKLVCGRDFSYVLTTDGKLYCWGYNLYGQSAGLATTTTPQLMTGGIFNGTIDDITTGINSAACITNNKVYAWGSNTYLEVPARDAGGVLIRTTEGASTSYSTPIEVINIPDTPVRLFSANSGRSPGICCLTSNNEIYVWGSNPGSAYGIGGNQWETLVPANPTKVSHAVGKTPVAVGFGTQFTITLMSDGTIYGAGRNQNGDGTYNDGVLGNLSIGIKYTPELITTTYNGVTLPTISKLSTNGPWSLLSGSDGYVYHMGSTHSNYNNFRSALTPVTKLITDTGNRTIQMAWTNSTSWATYGIFLTTDNKVYFSGYSDYGETLHPGFNYNYLPIKSNPKDTAGLSDTGDVMDFKTAENLQTVLTTNGHLYSIGLNDVGQFGRGNVTSSTTFARASGPLLTRVVTKYSLGRNFAAALTSDGNCYVWGYGAFYQLGLSSSSSNVTTPTLITISGETIVDVGCGYGHTVFVCASGKVYSAGWNAYGQLGVGNTTSSSSANWQVQEVTYFTTNNIIATKVACGQYHTLIVDSLGKVYGFGMNSNGQIGDNSTTQRNSPVLVSTNISTKVISRIECGSECSMAMTTTGEVYTWGRWSWYTVSRGNNNIPIAINLGGNTPTWIRCGSESFWIITQNNKVFFAGTNQYAQLGNQRFAHVDSLTEYDTANFLSGNTVANQSRNVANLTLTNNISTSLVDYNLNSVSAVFANFVDAGSGSVSLNSVAYASSIYSANSIGNSTLVPYSLTPVGAVFSDYITLDIAFNWNESVRVYYGTTQISTSDTGSGVYYSLPDSTTVRLHTTVSGNFGLYNFIDVPGAPTGITASRGVASATVSFTAPVNNGGAAISSYTVTSYPGGFTASGPSSPITVNGLAHNTSYYFYVYATNVAGNSANSSNSNTITTATTPSAPRSPSAVAYDGFAVVTFRTSVNNGGGAITSYTAVSTPGNITATGASTPIIVNGLTNGTSYTFRVYATNGVGNSVNSSASASVTPVASTLTPEETASIAGDILTAANNTSNLTKTDKKTVIRRLKNASSTNRFITTTVEKITSLTNTYSYSNQTPAKIILLDENDTTAGEEQPLIDVTNYFNNNEVIYFPINENESVKFLINGTTYTASATFSGGNVDTVTVNGVNITALDEVYGDLRFVLFGSFGFENKDKPIGGAGSDPYITTLSGNTFELPKLNKWWNLFTDKSSDLSILAHSHNYSSGNFFNLIKVNYGELKATIDFAKQKVTMNNSMFKLKKSKLNINYNLPEIERNENKEYDILEIDHPEFKKIQLVINWRNRYIHPVFKQLPKKKYSGLLTLSNNKSINL